MAATAMRGWRRALRKHALAQQRRRKAPQRRHCCLAQSQATIEIGEKVAPLPPPSRFQTTAEALLRAVKAALRCPPAAPTGGRGGGGQHPVVGRGQRSVTLKLPAAGPMKARKGLKTQMPAQRPVCPACVRRLMTQLIPGCICSPCNAHRSSDREAPSTDSPLISPVLCVVFDRSPAAALGLRALRWHPGRGA